MSHVRLEPFQSGVQQNVGYARLESMRLNRQRQYALTVSLVSTAHRLVRRPIIPVYPAALGSSRNLTELWTNCLAHFVHLGNSPTRAVRVRAGNVRTGLFPFPVASTKQNAFVKKAIWESMERSASLALRDFTNLQMVLATVHRAPLEHLAAFQHHQRVQDVLRTQTPL